ncbi:deoxyuridine 5'-triphosphate nucleotidohydrolase [Spirochaetia bacterium]|nr:deoxyuridine 5'-triphosphate nucleotidohydrolase [Spirochaetia bacterium]
MDSLKAVTEIRVLKLDPAAWLPEYATDGAAGADIRARTPLPIVIPPLGRARIPTGLALEITPGYEAQVRPRSGLAAKWGVTVLNSPGTIDSDYRGELGIILVNLGQEPFTVHDGDRIAQLVIAPVCRARMVEAASLSGTERGEGGFGSTGI